MKPNNQKKIFIVWARETELSRYLARGLGAELRQVYYKNLGDFNIPTVFRYIFQTVETLMILFYEQPGVVIAQNPPVFAPLVCRFYCRLFGAKLAIDSHTAAFLDYKWIKFHHLFKKVARQADINSCHNYKNLETLKSWGIEPAMVMQFFNPAYDLEKISQPLVNQKIAQAIENSSLPIMMVNRFASDDDWETVVKTARLMPEADFFITGQVPGQDTKDKCAGANIHLTGYLKHNEFLKLMWRASVILAFTLRRNTVLWSIREIMALNKPFVTTDSEALRHYFGQVGLFTKSDAAELKDKIFEAKAREAEIKAKIKIFLEQDRKRWDEEIAGYKKYLD